MSCECNTAGYTDSTLAKGSLRLVASEMAGWRKEAGLKEQFGLVGRLPKPSCADKSELVGGKADRHYGGLASPVAMA